MLQCFVCDCNLTARERLMYLLPPVQKRSNVSGAQWLCVRHGRMFLRYGWERVAKPAPARAGQGGAS